jgi:hypothetical protein
VTLLDHVPLPCVFGPFLASQAAANANDHATILIGPDSVLVQACRFVGSRMVANAIIVVKKPDGMSVCMIFC